MYKWIIQILIWRPSSIFIKHCCLNWGNFFIFTFCNVSKPSTDIETNDKRQAVTTLTSEKVHHCILSSSLNYLPFPETELTKLLIFLHFVREQLQSSHFPVNLRITAICMLYSWSVSDVPSFLFFQGLITAWPTCFPDQNPIRTESK